MDWHTIRTILFAAVLCTGAVSTPSSANDSPVRSAGSFGLHPKDTPDQIKTNEQSYHQKLNVQPDNAALHFEFGEFLIKKGIRDREALGHFRKAAELEPANKKYKTAVMNTLMRLKDYKGVVEFAKEAGVKEPPVVGDFYPSPKHH